VAGQNVNSAPPRRSRGKKTPLFDVVLTCSACVALMYVEGGMSRSRSPTNPPSFHPRASLRLRYTTLLRSASLDVDVGAATALIPLCRYNLIVVLAEVETDARPSVEVVLHIDAAFRALVLTDRPILLKGPCAVDRWLVGPGRDIDVVGSPVGCVGAFILCAGAGIVCSCRLGQRQNAAALGWRHDSPKFSIT
jgi:hypothetical protein